jgi:hypothetical protein
LRVTPATTSPRKRASEISLGRVRRTSPRNKGGQSNFPKPPKGATQLGLSHHTSDWGNGVAIPHQPAERAFENSLGRSPKGRALGQGGQSNFPQAPEGGDPIGVIPSHVEFGGIGGGDPFLVLGRRRCGGAIHIGPPAFAVLGFARAHPRLNSDARIRGLGGMWVGSPFVGSLALTLG